MKLYRTGGIVVGESALDGFEPRTSHPKTYKSGTEDQATKTKMVTLCSIFDVVFLLGFSGIESTVLVNSPPQCYNCDRVVSPVDCETVITCGADQQCFTDKYVTEENHVLYNLGCKMNKVCSLMAQIGRRAIEEEDSQLDKRSIIHLCTKCCNAGYCNNKLCTDVTTPVPALRCYACNDLESVSACETLKNCEANEECFAETFFTDMNEIRHHLGCRQKRICDIISMHNTNTIPHGKRQQGTHICNGCCNTSFCNIAGCQNITNKHFG